MKISPKAFGLALGIVYGLAVFAATLFAVYTQYLYHIVELLVGVYPYYDISLAGAFAGLIFGFIDGLIVGLIFSWIYNAFAPGSVN